MVSSIIGEDLTIRGNVTSKGELQVDGEIEGDIVGLASARRQISRDGQCCGRGCSCVRPHCRIRRALRITLQAQSHVEGDIFHHSLAIEQGAYFEGKSHRSDDPLAEIKELSELGDPNGTV